MSDQMAQLPDPLQRAVRVLWPSLPMLLCGSILVAAAWSLIRMFTPGGGPVAVMAVGLVVVALFANLLHGCGVLLTGDHFGITHLLRDLPRISVAALKITLLPTCAAVLTSVSVEAWRHGGAGWMLLSIGVGGAVTLLSGLIAVVALPYVTRTGVDVRRGWLVASYITTRNPVPVLAAASAVVLAVWATAYLSFAVIMLLPGPVALVWAAAVRQATDRGTERLARRTQTTS